MLTREYNRNTHQAHTTRTVTHNQANTCSTHHSSSKVDWATSSASSLPEKYIHTLWLEQFGFQEDFWISASDAWTMQLLGQGLVLRPKQAVGGADAPWLLSLGPVASQSVLTVQLVSFTVAAKNFVILPDLVNTCDRDSFVFLSIFDITCYEAVVVEWQSPA
eukprot:6247102-Lingulodinium_polyedra.AAC.1